MWKGRSREREIKEGVKIKEGRGGHQVTMSRHLFVSAGLPFKPCQVCVQAGPLVCVMVVRQAEVIKKVGRSRFLKGW